MHGGWRRLAWLGAGHVCLVFGVVGVFLPLLPTTPFLLLASVCYSRGSQTFEHWLLNHPRLGPGVREWRSHGVIRRRAKVVASIVMAISLLWVMTLERVPVFGKLTMLVVMAAAVAFIWTRPSNAPP